MKRLTKFFVRFMCALLLCAALGASAGAADMSAVDLTRKCSLTVVYAGDGVPFEGLNIEIYRMAELADGVYTLAGDFASYPVDISHVTTQAEWRTVAETLASYVVTDGLVPTAAKKTDENGEAVFTDLGVGMYLVLAKQHRHGHAEYLFEDFLAALPGIDGNGGLQYDVRAIPKYGQYMPAFEEAEYRVIKQWKDGGGADRPDSVAIEIYKDGVLQSTQSLSGDNNWSYAWKASDDGAVWTVKEPNVPHGYTVTTEKKDSMTFVVTNYREPTEDSSDTETVTPKTGDTAVLWPYVLLIFFAGAVLAAAATRGRRVDE